MDDTHEAYLNILKLHGCDIFHSGKYVRKMITDNIDNVDFIHAVHRNQAYHFCFNAATIAANDAAVKEASMESDMKNIFQCSEAVHKAILDSSPWKFDGTLATDLSSNIPSKLIALLQWILTGVVTDLNEVKRASNIKRQVNIIAQQIMYQRKSDRQIQYLPKTNPNEALF